MVSISCSVLSLCPWWSKKWCMSTSILTNMQSGSDCVNAGVGDYTSDCDVKDHCHRNQQHRKCKEVNNIVDLCPPPPLPSILCYILGNSWKHPLPKKALLKNHIPLQNHRSPPKILRLSIYRFRERAEHSLDWSILTSTVTQIGIWKLPPPHHHQKGFVSKTQTLQCHKAHTPQVSGRLRLHYC